MSGEGEGTVGVMDCLRGLGRGMASDLDERAAHEGDNEAALVQQREEVVLGSLTRPCDGGGDGKGDAHT